jgi:preprotein translocase subunit SecE
VSSTAVETTTTAKAGLPARIVSFYHDVVAEMRRVTWPDPAQIRQATLGIIGVVLFIGAVIGLLDLVLQTVVVKGLPSLFAR